MLSVLKGQRAEQSLWDAMLQVGIADRSRLKFFISTVSTVSESHDTQSVKYSKSHRLDKWETQQGGHS